jgi:hypothetical protein
MQYCLPSRQSSPQHPDLYQKLEYSLQYRIQAHVKAMRLGK